MVDSCQLLCICVESWDLFRMEEGEEGGVMKEGRGEGIKYNM